jgi:hypothetical protein
LVGFVGFICRAQLVFHPSDPMVKSQPARQIKPKAQTKTKATALADVSWFGRNITFNKRSIFRRFEKRHFCPERGFIFRQADLPYLRVDGQAQRNLIRERTNAGLTAARVAAKAAGKPISTKIRSGIYRYNYYICRN